MLLVGVKHILELIQNLIFMALEGLHVKHAEQRGIWVPTQHFL
jgi:hypothetical protein